MISSDYLGATCHHVPIIYLKYTCFMYIYPECVYKYTDKVISTIIFGCLSHAKNMSLLLNFSKSKQLSNISWDASMCPLLLWFLSATLFLLTTELNTKVSSTHYAPVDILEIPMLWTQTWYLQGFVTKFSGVSRLEIMAHRALLQLVGRLMHMRTPEFVILPQLGLLWFLGVTL